MREPLALFLLAASVLSAQELKRRTDVTPSVPKPRSTAAVLTVPAGTKIPLQLRQPVSTKGARIGDPIYGQTTFPVVVEGNIVIPAGTWVQGVVDTVKRAGRIKGSAEMQFHLTNVIYANGYMLDIASAIDQVPGDTGTNIKEPGVIQRDPEKAKDLERAAQAASTGGGIGALAGAAASPSIRGFGVGGVAGMAAGTLIALMARGSDVTFPAGTAVEIALTQPMAVDRLAVLAPAALPPAQ